MAQNLLDQVFPKRLVLIERDQAVGWDRVGSDGGQTRLFNMPQMSQVI